MNRPAQRSKRRITRQSRRGLSSVWLLIALPTLLVLFCFMINIANLWLARVELENALESAALAAVLEWGEAGGGPTEDPRMAGVAYAAANKVRCQPLVIGDNLAPMASPANPNQNLTCDLSKSPPLGNLIFGAITNQAPLTFDASAIPSCSRANVLIEVCKSDSGTSTEPDMFGVFYRDGNPGVSILRVEIELPIPKDDQGNDKPPNQWPYWDGSFGMEGRKPVVSLSDDPDAKNLNNATPAPIIPDIDGVDETYDARGLNVAPTTPNNGDPQKSDWDCPNPNGSQICFSFADLISGDDYRTLRIEFANGEFMPPADANDDSTWEFIRFGASLNRFGPPGFPAGNNNDGDMFGLFGAKARVFFSDNTSCEVVFQNPDDLNDDRSEAICGGGSGGNQFAVRAQAIINVPLTCGSFFLPMADAYCVSAKATAVYDCATGKARLVRIKNENFICP